MRKYVVILLSIGFGLPVFAQGAGCNTTAAEKKLTGAAKTEFIKQCEMTAAKARVTVAAKDKQSSGSKSHAGKDGNCGYATADL